MDYGNPAEFGIVRKGESTGRRWEAPWCLPARRLANNAIKWNLDAAYGIIQKTNGCMNRASFPGERRAESAPAKESVILKKSLFRQILEFIGISGLGWLMDFAVYSVLTALGVPAGYANFLSALPAVTFVFFFATKKTFVKNERGIPLGLKYALYVAYQLLLLTGVSFLNQKIFDLLRGALTQGTFLYRYSALVSKILITPITMLCNFIVLKRLTERM